MRSRGTQKWLHRQYKSGYTYTQDWLRGPGIHPHRMTGVTLRSHVRYKVVYGEGLLGRMLNLCFVSRVRIRSVLR